MAVAAYTTDLTDIDLAETTTGWAALGGGGAGLSASPDFAMQGTNCVDKQITAANKGQVFDNGTGITMGANDHVFVWLFVATPGLTDTRALEGAVVVVGSTTANYNAFHVEGNNTYGAGGRVGVCYPIRYITGANASEPYRTNYGTPGATPQVFGGKLNTTGTVKSANLGVDALRYGTGVFITAGALATPGVFVDLATTNDASSARWGVFGATPSGYELQGRLVVGQNNAGTPTAAYFEDSNTLIALTDTIHSLTDFTQIIIDHASTTFNLTNVTILATGTNNPGRLVFNNASTSSDLTTCTFASIGISTLRAGVTATSCTWRSAGLVTQNGATLAGCFFDDTSDTVKQILSDDPGLISGTAFTSGGTGHAIEIDTPGTYTFTANTFSGYAGTDGSTGNECIYNNSGGAVTINVAGGGDTPTIRNGVSATTTVNNAVTIRLTVTDAAGSPLTGARCEIAATETVGTITVGDVLLTGTTNGSGIIEDTGFNYEAAFDPSGLDVKYKARLASVEPFYEPFDGLGTITADGFIIDVALQFDQ